MPGGRPTGSLNKNKQALIALLEAKYPGYHPVVEMAKIAHETDDPVLSANMHKEVAQYVAPKLKAVEISGNSDAPLQIGLVDFGSITGTTTGSG